jgi:ribosomal peptide maturation radical SAM protein 1
VNVLFVVMPFAAIRPAMGPSLLVSQLQQIGAHARVEYLSMRFAQTLGGGDYEYIADRAPTQSLAGDWVFAEALFGKRTSADAGYLDTFRKRFSKHAAGDSALATLTRARAKAEAFLKTCLEQVNWADYNVIGFTSSFTQHVASLALAQRMKALHPHLTVVFGGANCEDIMGLSLQTAFPFVDFVCSGEADISFPHLIKAMMESRDCHGIRGVISRRNGRPHFSSLVPERVRDLDSLPYPDFDDYFEQHALAFPHAKKARSRILLESSRGCWWGQKNHCTFCGLNGMAMTFRSKSPKRVLDEITDLCLRYSAEHVEMVDNILDMKYLSEVLPELARRRLHLELFYETKANLRKDQVRLLREAGVTAIQPGIESFSSDVLRIMRKGTTAAQNIQLLKWCSEMEVEVCWNLIYGFPGEDPADYRAMASTIDSISHLEPPRGFGAIRLDRFSPNFVSASELGFCNLRPDRSYQYIYDIADDHLFNLAYYFEHDYVDGRKPHQYVGEVVKAIQRWYDNYERHRLIYVDHEDCLAIWDFRSSASQRLTILSNCERLVYLHCDQHRPSREIGQFLAESCHTSFELEPLLERLLACGLMLKVDGHYLSLAVRLNGPALNGKSPHRSTQPQPTFI